MPFAVRPMVEKVERSEGGVRRRSVKRLAVGNCSTATIRALGEREEEGIRNEGGGERMERKGDGERERERERECRDSFKRERKRRD